MKYQVLFSLESNEKVYMNVICCSCDGRFKGLSSSKFLTGPCSAVSRAPDS